MGFRSWGFVFRCEFIFRMLALMLSAKRNWSCFKIVFFKQLNISCFRPKMRILPQYDLVLSPNALRKMHVEKVETLKKKMFVRHFNSVKISSVRTNERNI